ncbi:MAG: hypothetical protein PWQ86_1981 [Bacillota bacterium]|nr:hypothetical protein [Bacillota bacterium]
MANKPGPLQGTSLGGGSSSVAPEWRRFPDVLRIVGLAASPNVVDDYSELARQSYRCDFRVLVFLNLALVVSVKAFIAASSGLSRVPES